MRTRIHSVIPWAAAAAFFILAGCGGDGNGNSDAVDATEDMPADHDAAEATDPIDQMGETPDVPNETVDGAGEVQDVQAEQDLDAAENPDGPASCENDSQCTSGTEWCEEGLCVPCDNSGLLCDIMCIEGWMTYTRNGCFPCECAPTNACAADDDCTSSGSNPQKCYAGAFCWDWCPAGDPSCCLGNICSDSGCTEPPPTGCFVRGCPEGQACHQTGCASSGCGCAGGIWACDEDCGGGTCE